MAISWPANVNNEFYGLDGQAVENREQVKFKSGRVLYRKINSVGKKTHAVKLHLNDSTKTDGYTEFERFLNWYEGDNGSGTAAVELTDLEAKTGTKEYYVLLTNWDGQRYKTLNLTIEEV